MAVVEEDEVIDGQRIQAGDSVIGMASNGVHSNGFSLVRKVLEKANANANTTYGDDQRPLIDDLLAPTQLYADLVQHCWPPNCRSTAWPISPAVDSRKTCRAACRMAALRASMPPAGQDHPCSDGFSRTATFPNEIFGTPSTWASVSAWWCRLGARPL